jgi:hypothetical protein
MNMPGIWVIGGPKRMLWYERTRANPKEGIARQDPKFSSRYGSMWKAGRSFKAHVPRRTRLVGENDRGRCCCNSTMSSSNVLQQSQQDIASVGDTPPGRNLQYVQLFSHRDPILLYQTVATIAASNMFMILVSKAVAWQGLMGKYLTDSLTKAHGDFRLLRYFYATTESFLPYSTTGLGGTAPCTCNIAPPFQPCGNPSL